MVLSVDPPVLGALGPLPLFLLSLAEEQGQLTIPALLGILDVLVVRGAALQGVVEHAHQIKSLVLGTRAAAPLSATGDAARRASPP